MSEITQALTEAKERPSTVADWMDTLEDDDRKAIDREIVTNGISIAELHRILKRLDDPFPFGLTAFKEYARRVRSEHE